MTWQQSFWIVLHLFPEPTPSLRSRSATSNTAVLLKTMEQYNKPMHPTHFPLRSKWAADGWLMGGVGRQKRKAGAIRQDGYTVDISAVRRIVDM